MPIFLDCFKLAIAMRLLPSEKLANAGRTVSLKHYDYFKYVFRDKESDKESHKASRALSREALRRFMVECLLVL